MKKINIHNYEAYFLDYSEGNLNTEQLHELKHFLDKHPDLEEELHGFKNCSLPKMDESASFTGKDKLLKDERYKLNQLEMLLIGKIENELKAEEELKLALELMNPSVHAEYTQYQKTILREDKKVSFKGKTNLKKHTAKPWLRYVSVAAVSISIAFFGFSSLYNSHFNSQVQQANVQEQGSTQTNPTEQASPKVEMEKIPSSGLQLAELTNEKRVTANPQKKRKLATTTSLHIEKTSLKKRGFQTIVESMPKRITEPSIHRIAENVQSIKPAHASNAEYVTLPEMLKEHINQKILKNTLSVEFPNKEEKSFAFSFKGFELSHSSN